ncbi:MAG: hypothetical protein RBS36_10035 [Thiomicrospira sp.]|jgi:hypothetical protein|nr:hypothetical protein [Thiomicrospira sp.]
MAILRPLPERLSLESLAKRWGYDLENEVGVFFQDIASHCASGHLSLFTYYSGWGVEISEPPLIDDYLDHDAEFKNKKFQDAGLGTGGLKSSFRFDELESGLRPRILNSYVELIGFSEFFKLPAMTMTRGQPPISRISCFAIEGKQFFPIVIDDISESVEVNEQSKLYGIEESDLLQSPFYNPTWFELTKIDVSLGFIDVLGVEVQRLEDKSPAKASKKELWDMYGWYDDEIVDEDELEEYERLTVTGQHNGGSNNKTMVEQRMPFFEKLADEQGGLEQITQYKKDDIWEVLQKRNPELFDKGYDDFFSALNEKGIKFKNGRKGNSYIPIADK